MTEQTSPGSDVDLLTALLARRDFACPICGYNLRHAPSDRCPECGARLELRIGSTDLKLGAWLTVLFGLMLPFALLLLMSIGIVTTLIVQGSNDLQVPLFAAIFLPLTAAYGTMLVLAIRWRRSFLRRTGCVQRVLAAVCIVMNIAVTVCILMMP